MRWLLIHTRIRPKWKTNLPGTGYSRLPFSFSDNLVSIEIDGVNIINKVYVISGTGLDIERVASGFINGIQHYVPGPNMEHDFVIETSGADATTLKSYFDGGSDNSSMTVIVRELDGTETFRINLFSFSHFGYVDVGNGITRFTFVQSQPVGTSLQVVLDPGNPFGNTISDNPLTDTLIEISGVTSGPFYPEVEVDNTNNFVTLSYDITEGFGLASWVRFMAQGLAPNQTMSVIQQDSGGNETSRTNFYEVFPVSWEIYNGFGLHNKIKARIVLSFDFSEIPN